VTEALLVSLRVVGLATLGILGLGLPLAIYLARARGRARHLVEIVVLLPLVLPPTVLGYFLLLALGRGSPLTELLGIHLLFTVPGAAVAATVVGLPLMVLTTRAAIASVDRRLEDVARTLGAREHEVLRDITFPLAKRGIAAGLLLGIARATGEFGATLMVAGSTPGRTRTLPIALYEAVQLGERTTALGIVLLLTTFGLAALVGLRLLQGERT
jgi:molybdate transport system permease protein